MAGDGAGEGLQNWFCTNTHGPRTAQCDAAESRIFDEFFPRSKALLAQAISRVLPMGRVGVELVGLFTKMVDHLTAGNSRIILELLR